jgi:hypothetical protein
MKLAMVPGSHCAVTFTEDKKFQITQDEYKPDTKTRFTFEVANSRRTAVKLKTSAS